MQKNKNYEVYFLFSSLPFYECYIKYTYGITTGV